MKFVYSMLFLAVASLSGAANAAYWSCSYLAEVKNTNDQGVSEVISSTRETIRLPMVGTYTIPLEIPSADKIHTLFFESDTTRNSKKLRAVVAVDLNKDEEDDYTFTAKTEGFAEVLREVDFLSLYSKSENAYIGMECYFR